MGFTETTSNGIDFRDIGSYENNWKSFYRFADHSAAICYQTSSISPIDILPVLFRAVDTYMLIVLIYQPPSLIGIFIYTFIIQRCYWLISILIKDLQATLVY